jgi:light-regulated signal transduction histidine kinase (bacteriophytochrome)
MLSALLDAPTPPIHMIKHLENTERAPADIEELSRSNTRLVEQLERQAAQLDMERAEMDNLTHSISHDLRAPIHIITGFAELLATYTGRVLDDKAQHYLDRITTASVQLAKMMDEILALSRMSRTMLTFASVDLGQVVSRLVDEFDAAKAERKIHWIVGQLPTVEADPDLMRQVVSSLLSNAVKFTRAREVARIQVGSLASDGELTIFVRDNGAISNVRHRERMFDENPGQQGPDDGKVGMVKLACIQRIVQRHGGRMWTEAVPGAGVTFNFSLPAKRKVASQR